MVNVGVNASHPAKSPLFPDGTFEFIPIPEEPGGDGVHVIRYDNLTSFNHPGVPLRHYIPQRLWSRPCHADPEFATFTYGDNCETSPRAAALKGVQPGDYLFFLARLRAYQNGVFTGVAGFYLIGYLAVATVFSALRREPPPEVVKEIRQNAHVRRALDSAEWWNGFWVFQGSAVSRRFRRAVPFTLELAQVTLTDAKGQPWRCDGLMSPLQVIGSYTRTCRCIIDPTKPGQKARAQAWWDAIAAAGQV